MSMPHAVVSLAARQDQLITREQATNRGMSASAVDRRLRTGELVAVHPGVYRLGPADDTFARRCRAALLALGPNAALARRGVAALSAMPGVEPMVEVAVSKACHRSLVGVTVLRVDGPLDYSLRYKGMTVHDHPRAVIDLASVLDRDALELVVDHCLRRRSFTLDELEHIVNLRPRRGRRGIGVLASLIAERGAGAPLVMSTFEQRLFLLLKQAGLPLPERQHRVRVAGGASRYIDFAYPELKIAIEAESYEHHSGRQAWSRDRVRQNSIAALGWTRVDVTWDDLVKRPDDVIGWITAARRAASAKSWESSVVV